MLPLKLLLQDQFMSEIEPFVSLSENAILSKLFHFVQTVVKCLASEGHRTDPKDQVLGGGDVAQYPWKTRWQMLLLLKWHLLENLNCQQTAGHEVGHFHHKFCTQFYFTLKLHKTL